MIDEEIHVGSVMLDVPGEDYRLRSFEHHFLKTECFDEFCDDVGSPCANIFRNALRFDHDQVGARVDETARLIDRPTRVFRAFGFEFFRWRGAAGAELDADLRLCLHAGLLNAFYEAKPVVYWQSNKTARDLDDVESEIAAFLNVGGHSFWIVRKDVLDKTACRYEHLITMGQFNDFTPDGVQGLGNMVLITHGNSDGNCPVTTLFDELLVANFTGFGPAQGLQFFAVEDPTNSSHVQGIEYPLPPETIRRAVGRCGTNPVGMPRRLVTAPGVKGIETWIFSLAGEDIFVLPNGLCVENTVTPTLRAGCVFDPFFSLAAADLGLSTRDLQSQRSRNNPLGVIGTWLTLDGQIPTIDRSLFGNTIARSRWGKTVATARIWHRCIPIAGVDGVLNTPDDRILLAGGGTSYGVARVDLGGEPTAPSAESFLPPNVNSEKPSP